jgi:serine/tyrosine/threonine adenylyltransferase
MRLSMMVAHLSNSAASTNGSHGLTSLKHLPKSNVFTSNLPADDKYPTPTDSHSAPRKALGPRLVRGALFTYVRPEETKEPELLGVSAAALKDIGISQEEAKSEDFKQAMAGNTILTWDAETGEGIYPWAQCYGGYQFGQWAGQLGDGRAISLFETTNPATGKRYELQLKGAGKTPYSRFADGKAVLRSSIREFVVSEALNALRIPTTRALSLVLAPHAKVARERIEPGAIVSRFAETWLRIGTFDLMRARGDRDLIRKLAHYTAEHVFSGWDTLPAKLPSKDGGNIEAGADVKEASEMLNSARGVPTTDSSVIDGLQSLKISSGIDKDTIQGEGKYAENRYTRLYREICRRNARTVALWQAYGFTNGVLNTDNTSIYGLSIDFGPFAFIDNFDPTYTPNHDDHYLRYSYKNQPTIIWWNLVRLGEAFGELLGAGPWCDDEEFVEKGVRQERADELIERAETIIGAAGEEYKALFMEEYKRAMTKRFGLKQFKEEDFEALFSEWLDTLEALELDFNQSFRKLGALKVDELVDEKSRKDKAGTFFRKNEAPGGLGGEDAARERIAKWLEKWRARVVEDWGEDKDAERKEAMDKVNPKVSLNFYISDDFHQG